MTTLRKPDRPAPPESASPADETAAGDRLSTGAPAPWPVWRILCEFANGSCACARTGGRPCISVEAAASRILDRAFHDIRQTHHLRRKGDGYVSEK